MWVRSSDEPDVLFDLRGFPLVRLRGERSPQGVSLWTLVAYGPRPDGDGQYLLASADTREGVDAACGRLLRALARGDRLLDFTTSEPSTPAPTAR